MNIFIQKLLADIGVFKSESISMDNITEENKHKVVSISEYDNYIIDDRGLTEDEIKIAIMAKQAKDVKTIKKMVIFFVILTCLAILIYLKLYFRINSII